MKKYKINIVLLGTQLHMYDLQRLASYKSKIFTITIGNSVATLPDTDLHGWQYSSSLLSKQFTHNSTEYDLTVGILEQPIEGNYFMHRTGKNKAIITLSDADDILGYNNVDILNYLLYSIYKLITLYACNSFEKELPYKFIHDETRGCLFDMCGIKTDVIYPCKQASICSSCESILKKEQLPSEYLKHLKKELKKIRQKPYYIISSFIKKHPILSIAIGIIASVIINIFSNFLFELFAK